MKIKKIASIIFAVFALALAAIFGLFPFLEHKINWDYVAAKFATKAADAGCLDLAEKISSEVKFKPFLSKANAHIALYKLQNEGEKSAADFIKTCGKNFDFEEYNARRLIFDISNEPDFAAGLLKIKYESQINSLKNPFLKTVALYNMSLKSKPKDASTYTNDAFKILKELPKSEDLTLACIEISQIAFERELFNDVIEVFKYCPKNINYFVFLFRFMANNKFYEFSRKIKGDHWLKRVYSFHLKIRNTKNLLNPGDALKYTALHHNYNWRTNNYENFNIPIFTYISFILGEKEAFIFYKKHAISDENIRKNQGSEFGYLSATAIYLSATGDFSTSYKILNRIKNLHRKLQILYNIEYNLKEDKNSIKNFEEYLELLR